MIDSEEVLFGLGRVLLWLLRAALEVLCAAVDLPTPWFRRKQRDR